MWMMYTQGLQIGIGRNELYFEQGRRISALFLWKNSQEMKNVEIFSKSILTIKLVSANIQEEYLVSAN